MNVLSLPPLSSTASAIANHLWQSTVFAGAVWLLTRLLRNNQARIRYALWLAASLKFLVPFSLLITLGSLLPQPRVSAAAAPEAFYSAVDFAAQPFAHWEPTSAARRTPTAAQLLAAHLPNILLALWIIGTLVVLLAWFLRWRRPNATLHYAIAAHTGRELYLLRRVEAALSARSPLPLRLSSDLIEPGLFRIAHPVLVWPQRLTSLLEDEHIEAILTHELMHARRRDNLTAALHMLVESVLWFHPLVWWIGRRLLDERERACDEAVVQLGGRPEAYAESILKACRFCIESPLPCVSGITGADLADRIRSIMTAAFTAKLTLSRKLLLVGAAIGTIAAPLLYGQFATSSDSRVMARFLQLRLPPPPPPAPPPPGGNESHRTGALPNFEVASIKPSKPDELPNVLWSPAFFHASHQSVRELVKIAYDINDDSQLIGGPEWIDREFFDIEAKPEQSQIQILKALGAAGMIGRYSVMLQSLLESRLRLQVTGGTQLLPVFALKLARSKPKLTAVAVSPEIAGSNKPPVPPPPPPPGDGVPQKLLQPPAGFPRIYKSGPNQLRATAYRMSWFTDWLSRQPEIHRPVLDQTGLDGNYDFVLNGIQVFSVASEPPSPENSVISLFTALPEQLGLKLEPAKAPMPVLIIRQIDRPSAN